MKNFDEMTGPELVESYNAMVRHVCAQGSVGLRPVKKFESLEIGTARCKRLKEAIDRKSDIPPFLRRYSDEDPKPVSPSDRKIELPRRRRVTVSQEADSRWRNWTPTPGCMTRPGRTFFERQVREERKDQAIEAITATVPALSNASSHKRADRIIRILVDANPRRAGTDAHSFFEAMRGGITVGEYLAKFPEKDQRKAAQWLWNTCRDNFVKLLP